MESSFWDQKYSTDEYVYTKQVNRFVKEHLETFTPGKAIDLAGGEGRNTVFFAKKGWQVENIDFSEVALEKCRKFAEEEGVLDRVLTTKASATNFTSSLAPVDLGIIAYLQVPEQALALAISRLVDSIKSGGVFFGVWHARENLEEGFGGPKDPAVLPTADSIAQILSNLPVDLKINTNRDGQVQTREGLRPSITLTTLARKQ
jgi:SAM-dependent methyltransferase